MAATKTRPTKTATEGSAGLLSATKANLAKTATEGSADLLSATSAGLTKAATGGIKTPRVAPVAPAAADLVSAAQRKRTKANGEGSIKEVRRGRWKGTFTVGYDDNGKQLRRVVTGATKSEVLDRMREARNSADAGLSPVRRDLTVAKYLDGWLTDVLPGTVAASTAALYRDIVRLYIVPHIGQVRLNVLNPRDVARMLQDLERGDPNAKPPRRPVSPNTRRSARAVLRRALRKAEAEGLVPRNVAAIADGVKVGAPEGRTLTVEQARALLDSLKGHRMEAAFVVALSLGLRRGELLGLTWDDIALDTQPPRLSVRSQLQRSPNAGLALTELKTRSSRRTVHLPPQVAAALREHRQRQRGERLAAGPAWVAKPIGADFVFRTPIGTPVDPDNLRHLTTSVTKAAGVGAWSPHELRHSAASLLFAQGVDMKLISELLGHSSIRVTADIYTHMVDAGKAVAADAMSTALWG